VSRHGGASDPRLLTPRALNRATLARQFLLERVRRSPVETVEHLGGMQAQAPNPPYFGLWTRLVDFQPDALSRHIEDRELVRIAFYRSTLHLVSAADCVRFRPLLQPVLDRGVAPSTPAGRDLDGADLGEVAAAGRDLVERRARTMAELGALLAEKWPERDPAMLARAVRARLPLVQVPPRGLWGASGLAACTTAEHWLDRQLGHPDGYEAAKEDLVLRYLGAFGPALVRDAQAWSGLTGLRPVFERLRSGLSVFRDEQGRELFDLPEAPRPDPDTPAPARYLPDFDNVLIGYADWTRIITAEQRRRVFGVNGVVRGTVLVDGVVRGMWRINQRRPGQAGTVQIEPFGRLPRPARADLTAEGHRLLAFADPQAPPGDVRFQSW
jgi:DNA glycosylase AlkZ-like